MNKAFDKLKMTVFKTLLILSAVILLCSCRGLELENKTEQVEGYTREQAMILIANERNRYENVYSDEIWKIKISGETTAFDKLTVQNVKLYMEQLKLYCMLAEERGITVTSQERDVLRQLTDAYMDQLSEADLAYIGCQRSDVQKVYTDIFTADKLINSITGRINTEISDSEAKVIKIQQIGTGNQTKALAILKRIKIDGADFNSMASRYTETESIELTLRKGAEKGLLADTAFSMEEGEVSNILAIGDMFYIIKCTNGYAKDDTLKRKASLQSAMNNRAFMEVLEPYRQEHNIRFAERFWDDIDFMYPSDSSVENFFELYQAYAG